MEEDKFLLRISAYGNSIDIILIGRNSLGIAGDIAVQINKGLAQASIYELDSMENVKPA